MSQPPKTTNKASKVIEEEKQYLGLKGPGKGFAITGGGIRSASFGLGVMQGLVANNKLKLMDYMSTVSGGGFLGSALTWALHQDSNAGTDPTNFPLGDRKSAGKLNNKKSLLLNFIRQHGDYLAPTSSLGMVSFVAVIVRSILLSLFVYTCFFTSVLVLVILSGLLKPYGTTFLDLEILGVFNGSAIPIAIILLIIYVVTSFLYSLRTYFGKMGDLLAKYISFIRGQVWAGRLWKAALGLAVLGTLPYIIGWLNEIVSMIVASGSTVFGSIVGAWKYVKSQKNEESSGTISDLFIYLGAFALIYGLLLLSYIFAGKYFLNMGTIEVIPFILLVVAFLVFGTFTNLNLIGPHRVWRNRLMEAYMPGKQAIANNQWQPAKKADLAPMEEMCADPHKRPYHILNTNLILVGSKQTKYRNRGGDNFIISRLWSGSDATGWRTTETFHKRKERRITLATAMATSSAALNPNAGVSGAGATRNSIVSMLLSILNLRLGFWTINPEKKALPTPPNFIVPGLRSTLFPSTLSETHKNIQLSDGGHFENLALYELIRRKLKLIVLSDGAADPSYNFDDLANAVEKVRVDFGAKITFDKDYGLDNLLPKSAGKSQYIEKYGIAKYGFALAKISYQDGTEGDLIYIKLTMINGLPTDVYSYKGVYPEFPQQSTADQFFDEKQFEAYRELGYYISWQMMNETGLP